MTFSDKNYPSDKGQQSNQNAPSMVQSEELDQDNETEEEKKVRAEKLQARRREVLKSRALLAARKKGNKEPEKVVEVVKFLLDDQMYALEVNELREVCTLSKVTAIPCSPSFVIGVINLRGQIIPIIDLRTFLDLPTRKSIVFNKALILETEDECVGFLADEVVRAEKFPLSSLQGTLATMTGLNAECMKGVTRDKTVLLDGAKILANPKLYTNGPTH